MQKVGEKYSIPKPDESVKTEDITLNGFWVRVYTPQDTKGVGMYFHGGGFCMGSVDQEDAVCRLISRKLQIKVVSVSYRLAPEHKYPAALDDCVEATIWSLSYLQASSITLIGASAGGNLALGVALSLIDDGQGEKVDGVAALVPITIHPQAVPDHFKPGYTAYEENANASVNTASAMKTFLDGYGAPPDNKYTSCLLHPRLKGLQRVYIAECGADTLRDDAQLFKERLESFDVPVMYDAYPGFPHYSWTFPSTHLAEHTKDFLGNAIDGIKWAGSM